MRWDPLLTRAMAGELDERLHRARVRSLLLEPDARRIVVYMRECTLVLEMHPEAGWISLLDPREPLPSARPLASRVLQVKSLPDESAIVFGLQRIRGKDEGVEIVAEFVGNRWNGIVVGYRSRQIRHVLVPRKGRDRVLEVGRPYEAPPSNDRAGVEGDLTEAEWTAIVEGGARAAPDPVPSDASTTPPATAADDPDHRRKNLLRGVAWTSSLNADHLLAGGWHEWKAMTSPSSWGAYLLAGSRGPQPYPLEIPPAEPAESLIDAMARARAEAASAIPEHALLVPADLLHRGRRELRKLEGKVRGISRELESTPDPGPIRAIGDLILARYHEVPRGADEVVLTGFEGDPITVELDPTLPPDRNAQRYYDEAARIERARSLLPARLEEAETEAARLRELVEGVESGEEAPEALAERLGPASPGQAGQRRGRKGAGARKGARGGTGLPYRSYRSSGGLEIRVGRGARKNDDLTFRHSSPDDIWMHVREAPGAHVILRWGNRDNPPKRDLIEAATLAALGSDARNAGTVPVDWTRRKYVRKPRNAAPGAVIPDRVETIFVEPDPALLEKLEA